MGKGGTEINFRGISIGVTLSICSINGGYVGMMDCQNLADIFAMGF